MPIREADLTNEKSSSQSRDPSERRADERLRANADGSLAPALHLDPSASPEDHKAFLKRVGGSHPRLTAHYLLQLQRTLGNRYVQRVVRAESHTRPIQRDSDPTGVSQAAFGLSTNAGTRAELAGNPGDGLRQRP